MKRVMIFILNLILVIVLISTISLAGESTQDSIEEFRKEIRLLFEFKSNIFRDIEWGIPVEKCKGMILLESKGDMKLYIRESDKPIIKNSELQKKMYVFYKNQLMMIGIETKGKKNFEALKQVAFEEFEGWIQEDKSIPYWLCLDLFGVTMRALKHDKVSGEGGLYLTSIKISAQFKEDQGQIQKAQQKPEWSKVIDWQGSGIKNTEPFEIRGSMWRIKWQNLGSILQIYVYRPGGGLIALPVNTLEKGKDISYIYEKGEFYLTINAIEKWIIEIEEKE